TLAVGADRLGEDGLRAAVELRTLLRLLRERLDNVYPDDVLLGHRCNVRELLLHVAQRRMRDTAVAICEHDKDRRDRQRDQRQLPLEDQQDGCDRDDRQDVLEEEDQAVAEEKADALEIDRRT